MREFALGSGIHGIDWSRENDIRLVVINPGSPLMMMAMMTATLMMPGMSNNTSLSSSSSHLPASSLSLASSCPPSMSSSLSSTIPYVYKARSCIALGSILVNNNIDIYNDKTNKTKKKEGTTIKKMMSTARGALGCDSKADSVFNKEVEMSPPP